MKTRNVRAFAFAAAVLATLPAPLGATGYYGPSEYLAEGWKNMVLAPEFYWELEVKRLSSAYHPEEKFLTTSTEAREAWGSKAMLESLGSLTADADSADFAAALKSGAIAPPDAAKATALHEAARRLLAAEELPAALPEEFDSEFADYHRGAFAYRRGKDHWDEARTAWEALLKRPEAQRHYRSVWAAFMLGKIAMKREEAGAVKWFQQTRELAKAGFADSLGLAADSYGWEARSEWKQGHPEKAAPLYLTQLALGDETAIASLKALIPDRMPVDGMLNYGPEPVDGDAPDEKAEERRGLVEKQLRLAASDPLLRRLVTVHILATETYQTLSGGASNERGTRWLRFVKEANPQGLEDAEYLGWIAYAAGKYDEAAEWLKLAKPDTPASCWLRSKFERRAGKLAEAGQSMAQAFKSLRNDADYTGWSSAAPDGNQENAPWPGSGESWTFGGAAAGNLGALHLERAEFIDALDTFLTGGLWDDAAFIAERILTADELKAYVDKQAPPVAAAAAQDTYENRDIPGALRYLLGRRLVREDRYDEARQYLKPPYDKVLDDYVKALKDGADTKLPKAKRARAWFHAAWLARFDGMELMGTEGAPDGFSSGGSFTSTDLVGLREGRSGEEDRELDGNRAGPSIAPQPSKQELNRLKQNRVHPEVRFHYRVIAAALAMRAAALMPDNTEELADVIVQAGHWVGNDDAGRKIRDGYHNLLEKRCRSTKGAAASLEKGDFVGGGGPWSSEEEAARSARAQ